MALTLIRTIFLQSICVRPFWSLIFILYNITVGKSRYFVDEKIPLFFEKAVDKIEKLMYNNIR
jgi:hypothetical protein